MATTLPVPIKFWLPDGWQAVSPDDAGAPDSAFVAVHSASPSEFTTNIAISGWLRPDPATLTDIADEAVDQLRPDVSRLQIADRREIGTPAAPGLTQVVRVLRDINGTIRDLMQAQVFLAILDTRDPRQRAVLLFVLTALAEQASSVIDDFQSLVRTATPTGADPG